MTEYVVGGGNTSTIRDTEVGGIPGINSGYRSRGGGPGFNTHRSRGRPGFNTGYRSRGIPGFKTGYRSRGIPGFKTGYRSMQDSRVRYRIQKEGYQGDNTVYRRDTSVQYRIQE